jgi:hypothetical protein
MPPDLRMHTFSGRARVQGMTAPIISPGSWHAAAEAIAPYAAQANAGWIPVITIIAIGVFRLLMEWQLRRTLGEIFQQAPGGSVIIVRKRGLGGTMWVQVGPRHMPGIWPGRAELR